jgi:hypothetical protein
LERNVHESLEYIRATSIGLPSCVFRRIAGMRLKMLGEHSLGGNTVLAVQNDFDLLNQRYQPPKLANASRY